MRWLALLLAFILAGCGDQARDGGKPAGGKRLARATAGADAEPMMRSGPQVPVHLPPGFTLYPGARVISNTVIERGGKRGALLVFETPDPLAKVMLFYRAQAAAAGMTLELDLGGDDRASLGGTLRSGAHMTLSGRQESGVTRAEFAHG